jgi:hypothetical protein
MTYIIGHNTETSHLSQEEYAQRHKGEISGAVYRIRWIDLLSSVGC